LYTLPIEVVIKNLETNNLMKLPDPRDFVIGMNFTHIKKEKGVKSSSTGPSSKRVIVYD
jgi:hypothetical protein